MCENCKETFNLSTKMPYLLPCGHTLCRFCLENIWEKQKKVKCPFDQVEHMNHIDSLPRNEILVDIIKHYSGLKKTRAERSKIKNNIIFIFYKTKIMNLEQNQLSKMKLRIIRKEVYFIE